MEIQNIYALYTQSYCVTTDTRKIQENCLYFAFKGTHFDGNTLAEEAIHKGALASFVEEKKYANPSMNIYYVHSTLQCLQDLAQYHRKQLQIPIIALTGSNGKTTTKELMAAALSQKFNTLYTEGNLNNHLGVPLTLLRINPTYEIAIIEMGANHRKEIQTLSTICQPDIGYITNFGKAHLEGFGGEKGIIEGKSELYEYLSQHNQTALVNQADAIQVQGTQNISHQITFGKPTSEYFFTLHSHSGNTLSIAYQNHIIETQLTGNYNFTNASAAIALALHFNIPIEKIKNGIEMYSPTNQRSQILNLKGKTIILDAYNANPSSMKVALENFTNFEGTKTVLLGDMFELGKYAEKEHQQIVEQVAQENFDEAYFVGEHFYAVRSEKFHFFSTKSELEEYLRSNPILSQNILIKASRGIALETLMNQI